MTRSYSSALVAAIALGLTLLMIIGALTVFARVKAAFDADARRTEQLLREPITPSPLDRVRADLTQ